MKNSPTMITLEVVATLSVLALCMVKGGIWWWILAGMVCIDILAGTLAGKAEKKRQAQTERDRKTAEYLASLPKRPDPAPAPAPEPEKPAKDYMPHREGTCVPAYMYADVEVRTIRAGLPYAQIHRYVNFRPDDGEGVILSQEGHDVAAIPEGKHARMIRDWLRSKEPVVGILMGLPFQGNTGKIALGFFRDLIGRARRNKDAFRCRLAGAGDWFGHDYAGFALAVTGEDDDRWRLSEKISGLDVGYLPASAVKKIRALDLEPEDASYYLEAPEYDEEKDREVWYVLVDP